MLLTDSHSDEPAKTGDETEAGTVAEADVELRYIDLEAEGITDPDERFEIRAEQFRRVYTLLNEAVPTGFFDLDPSPHLARHEKNEFALRVLIRAGILPWFNSAYSLHEYTKDFEVNSEYGLQIFFSTCAEAIIEDELDRAGVEEALAEAYDASESFTRDGLPTDGTPQQAKAGLEGTIRAYRWLLGEYHGQQI